MEVRINKNYNFRTEQNLFGLSIRLTGGYSYCKYPVNHQDYTSLQDAKTAKIELITQLYNGATIVYPNSVSKGINKVEPVMIKGVRLGFKLSFEYSLRINHNFEEKFMEFLDVKGLDCNGGNISFAITKDEGTVTEAERKAVLDWLVNEPGVTNVCVNKLVALYPSKA